MERNLFLDPVSYDKLVAQLTKDVAFLSAHNVLDYSLLVSLHDNVVCSAGADGQSPASPRAAASETSPSQLPLPSPSTRPRGPSAAGMARPAGRRASAAVDSELASASDHERQGQPALALPTHPPAASAPVALKPLSERVVLERGQPGLAYAACGR